MPRVARLYALPSRLAEEGIIRYGFHGLSYEYVMEELRRLEPEAAAGRVVVAHLGNGASMAAVRGGVGVDTTMGFTPTGGLVMGTRDRKSTRLNSSHANISYDVLCLKKKIKPT